VWQNSFGGERLDRHVAIQPLMDGGYLLAGSSDSPVSGNKTSPYYGGLYYGGDGWLVRVDARGQKMSERSFGGSDGDRFGTIVPMPDGGLMLAGTSRSPADGTKTSPNHGLEDFWVVRLDAQGNVLWDRSYGGTNSDWLSSLKPTSDGGFILAGFSSSPPGGTKTARHYGITDAWLVRVDAAGNPLWDVSFGGSAHEDLAGGLLVLPDGGFIVGGRSASVDGHLAGLNHGNEDAWVIRLDPQGRLLWRQTYGGSNYDQLRDLQPAPDGGFLVGALSASGPSGNKTAPHFGETDYWAVRIDSNGNVLWDRSFGGSGFDIISRAAAMPSGGWILAGASSGGPSGNKTSSSYGDQDIWLVRIDTEGNALWDLSLGGSDADGPSLLTVTPDGVIITGGSSYSLPGTGIKTSPFYGVRDIFADPVDSWIVALAPDSDCDGVMDSEDICPDTAAGAVVDANGCSIEQLAPCDGPWRNHAQYVKAVVKAVANFLRAGLIEPAAARAIIKEALHSDCGKRRSR
jgi:hypothetical protein